MHAAWPGGWPVRAPPMEILAEAGPAARVATQLCIFMYGSMRVCFVLCTRVACIGPTWPAHMGQFARADAFMLTGMRAC
eukprot:813508-Pleurochrysis_carterae.AAC.3